MNGTIGEIRGFAANFPPRAWALCEGQLMSISSNTAFFSILGTTYGGDGRTTFAVPDLRGRGPICAGTGPGLTSRREGSRGGFETNTLNILNLAHHTHTATISSISGMSSLRGAASAQMNTNQSGGSSTNPSGNFLAASMAANTVYAPAADNHTLNQNAVNVDTSNLGVTITNTTGDVSVYNNGSSQPVNNMQPYLTINWIICMQGVYPSRG